VVGVGDEHLARLGSSEDPSADEDDAVSRVGFLGSEGFDVGSAAEVQNGHAERLDQDLSGLWLLSFGDCTKAHE
jgi:hypothetical protein